MAHLEALWGSLELCTLEDVIAAASRVWGSEHVVRTPAVQGFVDLCPGVDVVLKLENLQTTGSFKIRGMVNKILQGDQLLLQEKGIVTFSAGNAGRAVAYLGQALDLPTKIFMPQTVPEERVVLLKSMGAVVEKVPSEQLLESAAQCIESEGRMLIHPFDDVDIIRGHASCGLEILEDVPDVDIVVVCCGGGGLLAGVAAAVKLKKGSQTQVIGVEPEGACSMHLSFTKGEHSWCEKLDTICHGLAPPFAGKATYNHAKTFVDQVVLVTDDEVRQAVKRLYELGLVVEASGAAAVAAVIAGKCGAIAGKKVVCTVSGRNISSSDLNTILQASAT
mmetsp:Transcript_58332/g.155916  ORF Transcript_58332/g.155916 Transcript_58332/m.155916 type:complete len:334 (-) Transcript_58332:12-1013(-)